MSDSANRHPVDSGSLLGRVGRWGVSFVPDGWERAPGFGIHRLEGSRQAANIRLSEDTLPAGNALAPYLVAQKTLIERMFANPTIAGPTVIAFPGADEAALLFLKHCEVEGSPTIIQAQTYVRRERWIGIVTLTAAGENLPRFKDIYQSFVAHLRICSM